MKDDVSSMVDGELSDAEAGRCLTLLREDAGARDTWDTCHLIGDALRGHLTPGIAHRVAEKLKSEPTVLARRLPERNVAAIGRVAMPIAAGAAAVAFVAWIALGGSVSETQVAKIAPVAPVAPLSLADQSASQPAAPVAEHILAHQRFSNSSAMQGVAPNVRTVASQGRTDR